MPTRRIADAWMETHNVRTIRFDFRDQPADFKPGQFLQVSDTFRGHDKPVRRAYSISSSPRQRDYIDITVKREVPGLMSTHLTEVPIGYEMEVAPPLPKSKYSYDTSRGKRVLLFGAGSGITPLHSISRYVLEGGLDDHTVFLFYSVRSPKDIIFEKGFNDLAKKYPNFHYHLTVTRATPQEWSGHLGRITGDWVKEVAGDVSDTVVYICGLGAMVDTSEKMCVEELNIPIERVNTEKW
ncbi:MAG: ferredoxin--NADP reductase [Planctomycetia bacterium]